MNISETVNDDRQNELRVLPIKQRVVYGYIAENEPITTPNIRRGLLISKTEIYNILSALKRRGYISSETYLGDPRQKLWSTETDDETDT